MLRIRRCMGLVSVADAFPADKRGGSITPIAPFLSIHQIWLRRGGPVLEGPMLLQEMGLKLKILPFLYAK